MNRRKLLKLGIYGAIAVSCGTGFLKIYKHTTGVQPISKFPDPVLRARSKPVEKIDDELMSLSEQLMSTIRYYSLKGFFTRAALGRGLAAPQLGISRRVIVCGLQGQLEVLINPEITAKSGSYTGNEYCLSLPGHEPKKVQRPGMIELDYLNLKGENERLRATEEYAAVLSHEIDHLNGILYIDHPNIS